MKVSEVFDQAFKEYCADRKLINLRYVVTSEFRPVPAGTPHSMKDNAQDVSLRFRNDYAPIPMYNDLFGWLLNNWPYRAGIDNTEGNIHIHLDLGEIRPQGQEMPFFFKEDGGRYQFQIRTKEDIRRTA